MFESASKSAHTEIESRRKRGQNRLRYGIEFLDDALLGIMSGDLILLGAPSGLGKTQLCCNIALANLEMGKRVHYIALEAEEFEIEGRLKFPLIAERFYNDPHRPAIRLAFDRWMLGEHLDELASYEQSAADYFAQAFRDLFLFYKGESFRIVDLIKQVSAVADDTDLIIVDHVHYFDFDEENENKAMKDLAKIARTLTLERQKPIMLVAHLRKRDRHNDDLIAGMEEFHGSSDLYKIATKVITMSPGQPTENGNFETFFRVSKNRLNGGVTRYAGRCIYSPRKGGYETGYKIGWAEQSRKNGFAELDHSLYPQWAKRPSILGSSSHNLFGSGRTSASLYRRQETVDHGE